MADKTQTHKIPALAMRALVRPDSVNDEKRTVELTWTTGARVRRFSWSDGAYDEELSLDPKHVRMGRLNNGAPFLADHDGSRVASIAGVVVSAKMDKNGGSAVVRFARAEDDPEADKIFRKVKDGIIQNVSVGYRVHKFEKVEGGDDKTPVFRATDWEPFELSAVAMGADDGAGFRSADNQLNPCIFITRGVPHQERIEMTPEEIAAAEAKAMAARATELKTAQESAAKAERERGMEIAKIVRVAKLDGSVADKMITDGTSIDQARAMVLEELAKQSEALPPSPNAQHAARVEITDDNRDKFQRGVSAWLFEKAGNGIVGQAKERKLKGFEAIETDGGEFRGMTLVDIARACCERSGISLKGIYDRERIVKLAMRGGGYATTGDFSVLFENVMHKQMRAAYGVQSDTWKRFCGIDSVSDFRNANRFMSGSFGALDVVAEGAEYKNRAIPDGAKVSISTQTLGGIIAITRQAIINDDMGALANLATAFGRSAGISIETAVYTLLALNSGLGPDMSDGQPYFHSNRANVSTGAALSAAALDADKIKMRQQRDISSNEFLDLTPRIILVPVGIETAVRILNTDAFDPAQTGQKSNSARGMFSDVVSSPRLTWSTTRRYLFTEGKEAFKVVFLEGTGEGPVMESEEDFRRDGMSWKARIDFKVNPYDPKHALTNAGT